MFAGWRQNALEVRAMTLTIRRSILAVTVLGLIAFGCKKGEESGSGDAAGTPASAATPATAKPTVTTTVTAPPVNHDADAAALRGCCAALRSSAASQTSPAEKSKYESAAASCDGIVELVRKGTSSRGSAVGQVRAALRGGTLPGACN